MRLTLICTLMASTLLAVGCDDEAFDRAVEARKARDGLSSASAAPSAASASASASAAPKQAARPEIPKKQLKDYAVLPEVFESEDNPVTDAKVELGRMLFYEKRLSKNHDVSCNSCHGLSNYGVDGDPTSEGHKGQHGDRNSPTVYNAGNHIAQFWDGRAETLEDQAKGPILNPVEMAMPDEAAVVKMLKSMPEYVDAFKKAFPDDAQPVSYDNMAKAIGAFERKLVTPSRFDEFLAGKEDALTDQEVRGFSKFLSFGCPTCHYGVAVGGETFQKLGLVKEWPDKSDLGRYEITKKEDDKMKFRVPSLRNVEKTAPYFHKGQVKTLPEVVKFMAWHQLGKELSDEDIADVVAFLKSLTGKLPTDYIKEPKLPESTATTPKADPT
jgi:cytochrome c peroxidase